MKLLGLAFCIDIGLQLFGPFVLTSVDSQKITLTISRYRALESLDGETGLFCGLREFSESGCLS
ncbi:unnamed protein product, partial [Sphenostylis stenocarpa]